MPPACMGEITTRSLPNIAPNEKLAQIPFFSIEKGIKAFKSFQRKRIISPNVSFNGNLCAGLIMKCEANNSACFQDEDG